MLNYLKLAVGLTVIISLLTSCKNNKFDIKDYKPIVNYEPDKINKKTIDFDYSGAYVQGFIVPSASQIKDSMFVFNFSIKNNTGKAQKFFYKVFYQNESYKFLETLKNDSGQVYENLLASENFYGSWEDVNHTFLPSQEISDNNEFVNVSGKIRIVGNPRNEKKFYGQDRLITKTYGPKEIMSKMKEIRGNQQWYASIKDKASKNKIDLNKQLELDANFMLDQEGNNNLNNRWKRNPRVGYYSFMLVITTEENLKNGAIPDYIQNISLQNKNTYVNPYYFFLYGNGSKLKDVFIQKEDSVLKITAKPDFLKGIFIDNKHKANFKNDSSYYRFDCNQSLNLRKNAELQQFIHNVAATTRIENIPLISDVSEYSKNDYKESQGKYAKKRKDVAVSTSDCPCKTVNYSLDEKALIIKNPGNVKNEYRKENVGVITRHGLTYGKYRVKAKLSNLLNKYNVWNGITNAVWLMSESLQPWNVRRMCTKVGYFPEYTSTKEAPRVSQTYYSEIDFEILKASHYWPVTSYPTGMSKPNEIASDSSNIMVTCTNWDMACPEPKNYGEGVQPFKFMNQTFDLHRWDQWYKAITSKQPFPNKDLFEADYYWFEIEWKPEEIIWRIGPEKDKMSIVCYMNNTVTNIPNNQMLLIITQEYHITNWWPDAPFNQEDIPFPLRDIVGKIYAVEIE